MIHDDILSAAGKYFGALNPLDIFQAETMRKMGQGNISSGFNHGKRMMARSRNPAYAGFGDYFSGYNLGEKFDAIDNSTINLRAKLRQNTAMAIGAYGASSFAFGSDNPVNAAVGFGASVAGHGIAASLMAKHLHPAIGVGYAGWGVANMLRKGDNFGPM